MAACKCGVSPLGACGICTPPSSRSSAASFAVGLYLSGALPIQAVRGGIRFPAPDEDAIQAAWEAANG